MSLILACGRFSVLLIKNRPPSSARCVFPASNAEPAREGAGRQTFCGVSQVTEAAIAPFAR